MASSTKRQAEDDKKGVEQASTSGENTNSASKSKDLSDENLVVESNELVSSSDGTKDSSGKKRDFNDRIFKAEDVELISTSGEELLKAVFHKNVYKVKELIRSGADVNSEGCLGEEFRNYCSCTPLILAVKRGSLEMCKELLNTPSIDVNKTNCNGFTALHDASSLGLEEVVELLLKKRNIKVNPSDNENRCTPLINAAWNNRRNIVKNLLAVPEILVNRRNKSGQTALHGAASFGHTEVVRLLLDAGIYVNQQDEDYNTALHLAVINNRKAAAEALLGHRNISVNIQNKFKQTALHISAYYGHLKITKLLLAAGIDVNLKTCDGRTALDWAKIQKNYATIEALTNHMKDNGIPDESLTAWFNLFLFYVIILIFCLLLFLQHVHGVNRYAYN